MDSVIQCAEIVCRLMLELCSLCRSNYLRLCCAAQGETICRCELIERKLRLGLNKLERH